MIEISLPYAIVGVLFACVLNGFVAFGGAWFAIRMKLEALVQQYEWLANEVREHKTALYGVNLDNGMRSRMQDQGNRIGNLERTVYDKHDRRVTHG